MTDHSTDYAAISLAEKMLRRHEGLRLFVYQCSQGYQTIGVGRNLESRGISADEAELMLANDIEAAVADLQTFPWWTGLTPGRKAALIDFRFNVGAGGVRNFKKMLAALEVRDYQEAAAQLLDSKYARQVGHRAKELADLLVAG